MKSGDKTETIVVRVTPKMNDILIGIASSSGKSKSEICRKLIQSAISGKNVKIESQESFLLKKRLAYELINEVNHIGTNINQIVHNVNSEYYSDYEKKKLFALMQKLTSLFQSYENKEFKESE